MATINNEIRLTQGDCEDIFCSVNGNIFPGQPIDVSGWTPYLTVKKNRNDASTLLSMTGLVLDASGTLFFPQVDVSGWIPATNLYDIVIEKDPYRLTIVSDNFRILDGVRN